MSQDNVKGFAKENSADIEIILFRFHLYILSTKSIYQILTL